MPPPRWRGLAVAVAAAVCAAALAVAGCGHAPAESSPTSTPSRPADWNKVWGDDFSGPAGSGVDQKEWLYSTGRGYPGGAANWGTGEVETMTSSTANVYHDGSGHLAIKPVRAASGGWTSGRIETRRTDFEPPAGGVLRVEASIQQPDVSGAGALGYWPAFWMLGAPARGVGARNWPGIGELDIMEDVNGLSSVWATMHCGVLPAGPCHETDGLGSGRHPVPDGQTRYHTYALEWDKSVTPETMRWYVDGGMIHKVDASQVDATTWANATNHGYFIILNVAMGGVFPANQGGGPTTATRSGVPMLVDHVAVYSLAASR
jgi:beta-glucanase (GH16 family)